MTMLNNDGVAVEVDWNDIKDNIDWITSDSFGADLPKNWKEIADYINDCIRGRLESREFWEDDLDTIADAFWDAFWQGEFADAPIVELA